MGWFSRVTHAVTHPISTAGSVAAAASRQARGVAHGVEVSAAMVGNQINRVTAPVVHQAARVTKPAFQNIRRVTNPVVHQVEKVVPTRIRKPVLSAAQTAMLEKQVAGIAHRLTTPADVSAFGGQAGIDARKGAVQDGPKKAPRPQVNPDAVAAANSVIGGLEMAAMLPIVAGGAGILLLVYLMSRN